MEGLLGRSGQGELFFDLTREPAEDAIDEVKADERDNVYVSGSEHPHNMAWGDVDLRGLYLSAQTGIYRLRLKVAGHDPNAI